MSYFFFIKYFIKKKENEVYQILHERMVKLMMECTTSATYSVLINGEPHGHIVPTRGLRQGDPLSPYLFLMCAEGLHGIISSAASKDEIQGLPICKSGPRITHFLFANDTLIFL